MIFAEILILAAAEDPSNWWEPGTAGALDVGDLAAILAFTIAVFGTMGAVSRWWMKALRGIIKDEISEATKPIQPGANGGLSLPDVARRVNAVENSLADLKKGQDELKDTLLEYFVSSKENKK